MLQQQRTSWHPVSTWYNKLVGAEGHYYHQHVVLPGVLRLLDLKQDSSIIDFGCGQGVLARAIPPIRHYVGLDVAKSLIMAAKQQAKSNQEFRVVDVTRPITTAKPEFSHAAILLALQNMERASVAVQNAAAYLQPGGKLVIVLNHPAFRIPRQSGWGTNEQTKQQYRWINRYLSPLKIPIEMNPGKPGSTTTWSFHNSLQAYVGMLVEAGFVISNLEEWVSDKESEGKAARSENRSRAEFPLFLTLVAEKLAR